MTVYSFDTEALTLTADGASIGTDHGWDAVRELARVVTERAANAEVAKVVRVVGEDGWERIHNAYCKGETIALAAPAA